MTKEISKQPQSRHNEAAALSAPVPFSVTYELPCANGKQDTLSSASQLLLTNMVKLNVCKIWQLWYQWTHQIMNFNIRGGLHLFMLRAAQFQVYKRMFDVSCVKNIVGTGK